MTKRTPAHVCLPVIVVPHTRQIADVTRGRAQAGSNLSRWRDNLTTDSNLQLRSFNLIATFTTLQPATKDVVTGAPTRKERREEGIREKKRELALLSCPPPRCLRSRAVAGRRCVVLRLLPLVGPAGVSQVA